MMLHVLMGRFCNKIAETVLQNIHRIEFLQHVADIGTIGYWCNHLRLLSQNSFEDVKLPVRVENCRRSHSLKLRQSY